MKRLGRVLGNLLAVALTVVSLQAVAETQLGGRDFNHMTTGFPLSGGHAAAACETCHMGGVFKGLPRTCDGCHQAGQRIVATPKSASHIVTDSPCESCHFNTSTFLGARFNHGTAKTGQCSNCHNGRISTGKPVNTAIGLHPVTIASCDQCHRASAWIPASWNHTGVTGDCSTCHRAAGPGRGFNVATHMSQALMTTMSIANCAACHKSYYSFLGAYYDHAGASPLCETCHKNQPTYVGVKQMPSTAIHTISMPNVTCRSCHKSYAVGSFPAASYDHAGVGTACETCHANAAFAASVKQKTSPKHTVYAGAGITNCRSCHTSYAVGSFPVGRFDHVGVGACSTCHTAANSPTIRAMATNHIPIPTTAICTACHYSASSWAAETMNHGQVPTTLCRTCHIKPSPYLGRMDTKSLGHKGWNSGDCSQSGCHRPGGTRGVLYQKWD